MTRIRVRDVVQATAIVCDVPRKDIIGSSRFAHIVRARHIGMVMTKRLTEMPLKRIGYEFGRRDHTTVIHALKHHSNSVSEAQAQAIEAHARRLANQFWTSFQGGTA